ncbi:AEC family transporter [Shimia abyssi]|uniref:Malonate transporter n=1 Tax=Shimia abyssi TaxID=1662395 RepID=A0A2P8FIS4_9RHOB|nr:AEC family transporter [Shimia abyssi]PSL21620.1 hypothetical protein CLV88_10143 [Shimia abyssi]
MLNAFADPIIPIFAVLVLGYVLARSGAMEIAQASAINRFVFYLAAPALVFSVIASAPTSGIDWAVVRLYFACEVIVYTIIFCVARFGFSRPLGEAILLGMAAGFSNHIFFVLPISTELYGPDAALPFSGIVIGDAIIFCSTVFLVELFGTGAANPARALRSLSRNPFVYAPVLGVAAWNLPNLVPSGIHTFTHFAGAAAAPTSLFALGIVLAAAPLNRLGTMMWILVGTKLALQPTLFKLGQQVVTSEGLSALIPFLIAAGPCGAMPFVIATQYNVQSETIAKAILISTLLSVLSLAVLT